MNVLVGCAVQACTVRWVEKFMCQLKISAAKNTLMLSIAELEMLHLFLEIKRRGALDVRSGKLFKCPATSDMKLL